MVEIRQTEPFAKWLRDLTDRQARARVLARIDRLKLGNFGDVKTVKEGLSELRIHYGPGYRVYFVQQDAVILLIGGTKSTQPRDIDAALRLIKGA
ncbi:MAG: type II toxin-antitoxin system RelE/ParE family toxin [Deltaproteobacteria bacterium]|nr:type II toxin-antitoxin system RelE/ParE family toxin [Deltaproteobacteria bacterium]